MSDAEMKKFMETVSAWGPVIAEIPKLVASNTSIEQKVDGLSQQLGRMENRVNALEQTTNANTTSVNSLNSDVNALRGQVNKLQQLSIANDFLLNGLPPSVTSQDVPAVLAAFGNFVGLQLRPDDFREPPRFFTNKNRTSGTIIGTFNSHARKLAVLKAFKAKRPVPVEDVVNIPELSTYRGKLVTMRNSLTPAYRHILSEAHRIKGDLFDYVWDTADGRILLRKEGSSPVEINSVQQLYMVVDNARNIPM